MKLMVTILGGLLLLGSAAVAIGGVPVANVLRVPHAGLVSRLRPVSSNQPMPSRVVPIDTAPAYSPSVTPPQTPISASPPDPLYTPAPTPVWTPAPTSSPLPPPVPSPLPVAPGCKPCGHFGPPKAGPATYMCPMLCAE